MSALPPKADIHVEPPTPALSVFPEALESIGRQRGVAHRRSDRAVAEVVLDCAGVLAVVCELVAAGMPQHVTVNEEGEARGLASPRDHALIAATPRGARRSLTNT
jgi:hypothetical protein